MPPQLSPWINSCIGFYNRKAFMLILFYTLILCGCNLLALLLAAPHLVGLRPSPVQMVELLLIALVSVLNLVVFIAIALFAKYHVDLIFKNLTTLETLKLKEQRLSVHDHVSEFDIGASYNWMQVFGRNRLTWLIPIFLESDGPSGDGVFWPKRPT